jgi:hypothetical protein
MGKRSDISWFEQPQEHNYPAAEAYLNLLFEDKVAADLVRRLKKAGVSKFKAKDIFRERSKLVIADGYHRLCSVYQFDEDAWIPCKIV